MTDPVVIQLLGALSNDLYRVATHTYQKSPSATRFLKESRRWIEQLKIHPLPPHINKIVQDISDTSPDLPTAEKYLMYSVLLQNYTLHTKAE